METEIRKVDEFKEYEGIDVSLSISLLEYGMAWQKVKNEYKFIYQFDPVAKLYDFGRFNINTDVFKEFSWISEKDWNSFFGYLDTNIVEWSERDLPNKIFDLFGYWGAENIFGSSMRGFQIVN